MVIVDHNCRVSICMPTFNGSRYLRIAKEITLSQTYTNMETNSIKLPSLSLFTISVPPDAPWETCVFIV
jgi:hypothetical protein